VWQNSVKKILLISNTRIDFLSISSKWLQFPLIFSIHDVIKQKAINEK